jgi:hypothetical protein
MDMLKNGIALGAAVAIGAVVVAAPAQAKDKLKDITCEQFLAMDESNQNNIVYWVEGAAVADSKKGVAAADIEVGYDIFGRPVAEVVTACKADKKATLWDKIKKHF